MLGSLPALFYGAVLLALKGANSVAPPRVLDFAAFVNDTRASKTQQSWPLRDNGAQVCPKTVTTSFAVNLLTGLVGFIPIYLFLRLTFTYFCSHFFAR